jgi:hypothetical protein
MTPSIYQLIRFLEEDWKLPTAAIMLALKQSQQIPSFLPITLWQYGLITLIQLDQIFDWLCDAQLD